LAGAATEVSSVTTREAAIISATSRTKHQETTVVKIRIAFALGIAILLLAFAQRQHTMAAALSEPRQARSGPLAYAIAPTPGYSATIFGLLDIGTGTFHPISTTPTLASGIAKDARSRLYFLDSNGDIYQINPGNGKVAKLGPSGITASLPVALVGMADGTLYAMDVQNNLYRVNAETGAATFVGATGIAGYNPFTQAYSSSLAADCQYLYYIQGVYGNYPIWAQFPTLWRIHPDTAQADLIGPITPTLPFFGAGFVDGKLLEFSFDETSRGGPGPKTYRVNVTSGAATFVSNLNVPSVYGAAPLGEGNGCDCSTDRHESER